MTIYDDLKARAAEYGVIPAFGLTKEGIQAGQATSVFVSLSADGQVPGFARLAIHDSTAEPEVQYLVELERLRALIDHPA